MRSSETPSSRRGCWPSRPTSTCRERARVSRRPERSPPAGGPSLQRVPVHERGARLDELSQDSVGTRTARWKR